MHEQSGGATRKYEERSDAERKQRLYVEGMNETRGSERGTERAAASREGKREEEKE